MSKTRVILSERIENRILFIRGQRVMLDFHLAALYETELRILTQAVRRNLDRFPEDFVFQLEPKELAILKSQSVISRSTHGGSRSRPYAFTEQGIAMLSSVLRSPRAISVNIGIMRAFVQLRQILSSNSDLARKLNALEMKYDAQFKIVFDAIRGLMAESKPVRPPHGREIGFHAIPKAQLANRKSP